MCYIINNNIIPMPTAYRYLLHYQDTHLFIILHKYNIVLYSVFNQIPKHLDGSDR